jgi:ketosteroid isomerase-like protein
MRIRIALFILFAALSPSVIAAQSSSNDERTIKELEEKQVALLLKGDLDRMAEAWLPEFTVNNPFGDIVNGHDGPVRKRQLTYSVFTRNIEKMIFRGEIAVVMGRESIIPSGSSENAGKRIDRRFTNIWAKADGKWRMLARHANVMCTRSTSPRASGMPPLLGS